MARKGIQLRIFFEILDGLGEIGLEKKSLNFYKCRGMSRFGEKKPDENNKASRFARRLKKNQTRNRDTGPIETFSLRFARSKAQKTSAQVKSGIA